MCRAPTYICMNECCKINQKQNVFPWNRNSFAQHLYANTSYHHINNHNCNRIFQSFCTRVFLLWFHYISLSSVLHQAYIRYDRVRNRKNLFWNSRLSVNWTRNIKSGEIQNNSDVFVFSLNFLPFNFPVRKFKQAAISK